MYGSEGKIEVTYRSQGITADKGIDYITVETNAIIMEPGQISALILVQVITSLFLICKKVCCHCSSVTLRYHFVLTIRHISSTWTSNNVLK